MIVRGGAVVKTISPVSSHGEAAAGNKQVIGKVPQRQFWKEIKQQIEKGSQLILRKGIAQQIEKGFQRIFWK